ncbi:hypothetical protein A2960_00505 [Candidatus Gottesmanbacteria bacterium RIFCSPLOWO2_01_FULL_39_12b]|uniref:Camelysin metallo-endopeptidase n=1 Tax=Candidatus Gottesmanbacteria bacterium RIFCSPLOWO2_01_FULL_39_12b TaxID=1798388 RepID=A0A1F6APP4_9BACT|nr:MAG: hypothetical protein A2960_00505 [Candidatus Gottesmanbacteria bacterium RIFCSPLOWO2_01_FULL_39_12b]
MLNYLFSGGFFIGKGVIKLNKILTSLLSIGAASTIVTAATFAAFTASASNTGNVFTSGTLSLATTPATGLFTVPNMKPGDSITQNLTVNNTGSLSLDFNALSTNASGDVGLYNALKLKVGTTGGGSDLYNGNLSAFTGFIGGARTVVPSGTDFLSFTVSLPSEVTDEALQGKTTNVSFNFSATQAI